MKSIKIVQGERKRGKQKKWYVPCPPAAACSSVSSSVACSALREEWPVRVCVVQLRGRSAQLAASLCVSQSLAGFLKWFVSAAFRTGFNH